MENSYDGYKNHLKKIAHLSGCLSLLHWDQEVYMPQKGAIHRGEQLAMLSGMIHDLSTDNQFENTVNHLLAHSSFGFKERRNLEQTQKYIQQGKKIPNSFVQKASLASSRAFQAWEMARDQKDFKVFLPALKEIIALEREKAELLGYQDHPYDALLDQYEPDLTVKDLESLFAQIRQQLVPLVQKIIGLEIRFENVLNQPFNKDEQWAFSLFLLEKMGYDFEAGRQDLSTHPFTTNFGATDVRVTTRVDEHDLSEIIWSTIHEGGHALYEQGLSDSNYGLPSGTYVSLGIHESQSRVWENNIGRGIHWWSAFYPELQKRFPNQLAGIDLDTFYKSINVVQPSLIRTSADELTYHLHILIRYELEKGLIEGSIDPEELEEMWNEKYKTYLGVEPQNPVEGILQDVHWSHGSFGYFPTYSIGSFYAAQFYNQAKREIPNLEQELALGNAQSFLTLMRNKIHKHGQIYSADQLCRLYTGESLNIKFFIQYAKAKFGEIYNF